MRYLVKELRPGFVVSDIPLQETMVETTEAALEVPWLRGKGANKVDGIGRYRYVHAKGFVVAIIVQNAENMTDMRQSYKDDV